MYSRAVILTGLSLLLGLVQATVAQTVIAQGGAGQADIVIAADATATERWAAQELARFLGQVTGATFAPVETAAPGRTRLLVGSGAARLADPAFSTDGLGPDGIIIRTVGDDLILAGGEPRGTLYAVYTFLEDQAGCRWWTPAASTIPHRPTLSVGPLNIRYKPVLEYRETDGFSAQDGDWSARNKYNGFSHHLRADQGGKSFYEPGFCHTFFSLIKPELIQEHPDWFSLQGGKRVSAPPIHASLCLSNAAMRRQLIENLKQSLRDAPAEAASCGIGKVRFYLPDGKSFIGDPGPGKGWDTSGKIKVTASSQHATRIAARLIDGAGLDPQTGLLQSSDPETMFMSGTRRLSAAAPRHPGAVDGEHWVAFEFDQAYPLGQMWIWNCNENRFHIMGIRRATIRCSETGGPDPAEWKTLFEGEIPEAAGLPGSRRQMVIDCKGARARYVVITAHNNWASAGGSVIAEVSQPDDDGPPDRCECPDCVAIEKEEGSAAGNLVRLVNEVAEALKPEFPDVPVSTLAYHYTQKPPAITRPRPDVIIRLCSIRCSFSVPLTDERNTTFCQDLVGWSKICQRLYIWDYVVNFSYPLTPHPNLRVLGPNIRFLVDHGVRGYFAEALPNSPGLEMAELRSWVLSKLMWNPQADDRALIEEFVRGYYGPSAGRHVLDYINLMHDAVEKSGDFLGLGSPPDARFLSLANLCKGWEHLLRAEKAAGSDAEMLKRVRVAQLPVMYVFLMRWDELKKEAQASGTAWPMPPSAQALRDRIAKVAQQNGISLAGVPSPIPF